MKPPEIHYVDTPLWVWRLIQVCLFLPALVSCPVFPSALVAIWNTGRKWKAERDMVIRWADSSRCKKEFGRQPYVAAPIQSVVASGVMMDTQGTKSPNYVPARIELPSGESRTLAGWADCFPEPIRSRMLNAKIPREYAEMSVLSPSLYIRYIKYFSPPEEYSYWEKVYCSINRECQ